MINKVSIDKEVRENHKAYLERKKLYKSFGYDVDKERDFILREAMPLSGKILEAGTGKGHFALALAKRGYSFVTFDISEEEQRFARLNIAYNGLEKQVDFRIEDGERTSFADASFDVVFSVNVLHHLANPYRVINDLIRVLAPHGKLIISDFSKKGFDVMNKIHALEGKTHESGKVSLSDAEKYLSNKGFSIKKAKSIYQHIVVATR
ncbi:MAG: class I SAM-dependent methyltransferase [Candidatus Omnitrophica bacterium]|nr:class I SAM-dependent methyltransferase [Candidatus Omnitrophota bacterium]